MAHKTVALRSLLNTVARRSIALGKRDYFTKEQREQFRLDNKSRSNMKPKQNPAGTKIGKLAADRHCTMKSW